MLFSEKKEKEKKSDLRLPFYTTRYNKHARIQNRFDDVNSAQKVISSSLAYFLLMIRLP